MAKYTISYPVTKTVTEFITVKADSDEDALKKAYNKVKYMGDDLMDDPDMLEIESVEE